MLIVDPAGGELGLQIKPPRRRYLTFAIRISSHLHSEMASGSSCKAIGRIRVRPSPSLFRRWTAALHAW